MHEGNPLYIEGVPGTKDLVCLTGSYFCYTCKNWIIPVEIQKDGKTYFTCEDCLLAEVEKLEYAVLPEIEECCEFCGRFFKPADLHHQNGLRYCDACERALEG